VITCNYWLQIFTVALYIIHIYPVSEGYLRKIPVDRRGKYHLTVLESGIFRK
jgi:hypothetical protein